MLRNKRGSWSILRCYNKYKCLWVMCVWVYIYMIFICKNGEMIFKLPAMSPRKSLLWLCICKIVREVIFKWLGMWKYVIDIFFNHKLFSFMWTCFKVCLCAYKYMWACIPVLEHIYIHAYMYTYKHILFPFIYVWSFHVGFYTSVSQTVDCRLELVCKVSS